MVLAVVTRIDTTRYWPWQWEHASAADQRPTAQERPRIALWIRPVSQQPGLFRVTGAVTITLRFFPPAVSRKKSCCKWGYKKDQYYSWCSSGSTQALRINILQRKNLRSLHFGMQRKNLRSLHFGIHILYPVSQQPGLFRVTGEVTMTQLLLPARSRENKGVLKRGHKGVTTGFFGPRHSDQTFQARDLTNRPLTKLRTEKRHQSNRGVRPYATRLVRAAQVNRMSSNYHAGRACVVQPLG